MIGPLLRTAPEGIDTTVWLGGRAGGGRDLRAGSCSTAGPAPTHKVPWTRRPDEELEAERLWRWCAETTGAPPI